MAAALGSMEVDDEPAAVEHHEQHEAVKPHGNEKMFTIKKWNAVAMWSWDVECDTCAICRVQLMGLRCWFYMIISNILS